MMRLEVRFSIRLGREKREATERHDTFESQGALIESAPQPRYVGFEALS